MFYQESEFLQSIIRLVKECNNIVLNVYNSDFTHILKEDESPITIADQKCNTHIVEVLNALNLIIKHEHNIDICIISEEIKNDDYDTRIHYDWCWLVDPIDGTKDFIKRNGEFTVNIGLCYKGTPVFGIVSIPCNDELYYGISEVGSYYQCGYKTEKLKIVRVKNKLEMESPIVVASRSHMNEETENFISSLKNPTFKSVGSSIKFLYVAHNKAHIYPRMGPTSEWDTCAAHAVVKYAGGNVFKYENGHITGKELKYNKINLLNPYFVVQ